MDQRFYDPFFMLLVTHINTLFFTIYGTALIQIKGEASRIQDLNQTTPGLNAIDNALHVVSDFHVSKHFHEHYFGSSQQPCEMWQINHCHLQMRQN